MEEKYNNRTFKREPDEDEYYDSEDAEEADMDSQDIGEHGRRNRDMDRSHSDGYDRNDDDYDMSDGEAADERGMEDDGQRYPDERSFLEDDLVSSLHEARAEEELAREMSRMEPYDEEESGTFGETRVLDNIRDIKEYRLSGREGHEDDELAAVQAAASEEPAINRFEEEEETIVEDWDLEPDDDQSNHLMIEAEDPEKGLVLALESLKKIHRELGTKNPVAKISGENLNKKGIFAVADRLAGKDLVVERAGDLDRITIGELSELMEQDNTGMIVVLIDTPVRMERMHNSYPSLAGKFQYIGCEGAAAPRHGSGRDEKSEAEKAHEEELLRLQAEREAEAARKRLAEREEEIRRQAARDAEEARRLQMEREEEARRQEEESRRLAEYEAEEAMRRAEYEAANAAQQQAELEADEARRQAEYEEDLERRRREMEENERRYQYESGDEAEEELEEADDDEYQDDTEEIYPRDPDDGSEMDVEEFAQYACKYAAEIDCSISGKSMLALYERAEMMEEDGVPLTKANAEDLIEEAADKAEKRSFGGMFSSKYDKDGLLILKEKHFFD